MDILSWCTKTSRSSYGFERAGAQIHARGSGHQTRLTFSGCMQPFQRSSRYIGLWRECMKAAISPSAVDRLEQVGAPIQARSGGHPTLLTGSKCAQSFLRSVQYEEIDLPWSGELSNLRSHALSPVLCMLNRLWFYENSLVDRGTVTLKAYYCCSCPCHLNRSRHKVLPFPLRFFNLVSLSLVPDIDSNLHGVEVMMRS